MAIERGGSDHLKLDVTPYAQREWRLKPLDKRPKVVRLDRAAIRARSVQEGIVAPARQQIFEQPNISPLVRSSGKIIPAAEIPRV